jgi:hypothetical protein
MTITYRVGDTWEIHAGLRNDPGPRCDLLSARPHHGRSHTMTEPDEDPVDISKVHADDALINRIAKGEDVAADDPVLAILRALRDRRGD